MGTEKYITGSINISNGRVLKNSTALFDEQIPVINDLFSSMYRHFGLQYAKFYKMDMLSKLGWLASELLLKEIFTTGSYQAEKIGVLLANYHSSLDNDLKYARSLQDIPSPSVFVYTLPNIVIGEICIRNNFKGEHAFYIQERFDAAFFEQQVSYLLDNNQLDAAICGWVDVLENDYKAVLFLVEKNVAEEALVFSASVMNSIFEEN